MMVDWPEVRKEEVVPARWSPGSDSGEGKAEELDIASGLPLLYMNGSVFELRFMSAYSTQGP